MAKLDAIKRQEQLGVVEVMKVIDLLLKHSDHGPVLLGPSGLYGEFEEFGMMTLRSDGRGDVESMIIRFGTASFDAAASMRQTILSMLVKRHGALARAAGIVIHDCSSEENLMSIGIVAYPTDKMRALRLKLYH